MNNIISQIMNHQNIHNIFNYVLKNLFVDGPVSTTNMEILSYLYIYAPEEFSQYSNKILKYMGVNYKNIPTDSLNDVIFGMYKKHIESTYHHSYTPVQASIVQGIEKNQCFSFSAPTSTGKSYVFRNIINSCKKYIDLCRTIKNTKAHRYISQIKDYLGATDNHNQEKYSNVLHLLTRGIVVHHGSLPLQARLILEQFTQDGFCRICFATSTLEQGINMPFEVVFLNTFQASRPLSLKNIIGRAGRSSTETKFDYGSIVIHKSNMSTFREILTSDDTFKDVSLLEDDNIDDDYKEFKEAILSGTLSDEFNLTQKQLEKLSEENTQMIIKRLLDNMFENNKLISLNTINSDLQYKLVLYALFELLYSTYLGRSMVDGEKAYLTLQLKYCFGRFIVKHLRIFAFIDMHMQVALKSAMI